MQTDKNRKTGAPDLRFACDVMLGKLARELRALGFDTLYRRGTTPEKLISTAYNENRTLLTKRRRLETGEINLEIIHIAANNSKEQVIEVIKQLGISIKDTRPFSLCIKCNHPLVEINRDKAAGRVPEYVFNTVEAFSECTMCKSIYWQGTHYFNMAVKIRNLLERQN